MPEAERAFLLGRVLMVRSADGGEDLIVDGHQRLVTLTIVMCVLRDLTTDPAEQKALSVLIGSEDGGTRGPLSDNRYRLAPKSMLARVLSTYVQAEGATGRDLADDLAALSESEANVIVNRDFVRARLIRGDMTDAIRGSLSRLIAENCWLVVQTMRDEDEAWKLLNDEETTGLDFSPTDRAKTTILSELPLEEREACTQIWESWEHELGAVDTLAVLQHTRTLLIRARSEKPIEIDIGKHLTADGGGEAFFRTTLAARADLLSALRQRAIGGGGQREAISVSLALLTWVERQVWVPAAMYWQQVRGEDDPQATLFYQRLDRLVWLQRIAGLQPAEREARILRVLDDIDAEADVAEFASMQIERTLYNGALSALREKGFWGRRYSAAVLRRLALLAGDDLALAERADLTIEHVLPRRPVPGSNWLRSFTNRARVRSYADRLGNLTLLTSQENNDIGSSDYEEKRPVLAGSVVALAREVANAADWTPGAVNERTEAMIARLYSAWELALP